MTPQNLFDYHLGQLEPHERTQVETALAQDGTLAERARRLGEHLTLLLDAGEGPEPPAGLVGRTMYRIAHHEGPRAMSMPGTPSFRWTDLAVAAVVLIAGLGTLLPALGMAKRSRGNLQCVANLMGLGQGLNSFASAHGRYPEPATPGSPVGSYMYPLLETNAVSSPAVLSCPSGKFQTASLAESDWRGWMQTPDRPSAECRAFMKRVYSYNPGYDHGKGHNGPISWEERTAWNHPLSADGPGLDQWGRVSPGNSPNHGGRGQYVLYTDGTVRYLTRRSVPEDRDIYLNDRKQLAYGLHERDSVLFPGEVCLTGME
jgi:hypothetical protein